MDQAEVEAYGRSGEFLQDITEGWLLDLGGEEVRLAAHDEAGRYVDVHYPWNGLGDEPEDRVSAYIAALWQYAEAVEAEKTKGCE